ncbi:MAG: NAD(P)/FAD-dependent oxidoreductase [Acinetobacter sp.]|nr:MAG: NAD(P)/FAD-dependent oxidoreductase [Acinetobacter sp.]
MEKQVDILIVGAGISGIGLAVHLSKNCPQRKFEILERRESFGGTWDLFKYPGIRSDSDMSTFGYNFKPWGKEKVLASGPEIKSYLSDVIRENHLNEKIHYQHRVLSANYDSSKQKWIVEIEDSNHKKQTWSANFVLGCTGYYNYDQGYAPQFPQQQDFKGQLIHPQYWPENLDYSGKKVVIIGSGATAITLVPSLVKGGAAHVTMLQRSPTYIASVPAIDFIYEKTRKFMPEDLAYKFTRGRNIGMQRGIYLLAQKYPNLVRRLLLKGVELQLKGKVDMKHFTPNYAPWDQRLCVVPDGDLFKALREGRASVATDQIEKFTASGIQLKSGQHLDADIVVSATGLEIQILGGVKGSIDGKPMDTSKHMLYQGVMVSDVPNMAMIIGYINASWTLKVDVAAEYICRLINFMDKKGYAEVIAVTDKAEMLQDTVMGSLSAGYIARAADIMPKQGKHAPWNVSNNYLADRKNLKEAKFNDGVLQFKAHIAQVSRKPKLVS